jgi:hypothetical protein
MGTNFSGMEKGAIIGQKGGISMLIQWLIALPILIAAFLLVRRYIVRPIVRKVWASLNAKRWDDFHDRVFPGRGK